MKKSSLFIDCLELLYMLNPSKPNLLKMMKNISQKQKTLFPFVMHCDFSAINADGSSDLSDEFETLCKKQSNGQIKVSEQLENNLLIYASAIKPGSRFTDE